MNLYYTVMTVMAVLAVFVFIMLFYFKAGYGYLSNSKWGPTIPNKAAWIIMEAPSFFYLLFYTLKFAFDGPGAGLGVDGIVNGNSTGVLYFMAGLFLLHYFQRS